jgi:pyruvate dehydrogenase E1 component alpha subunit
MGKYYGIPSSKIDGNNILEVYQVANKAIERARTGGGPSLLESLTYRWLGHVGPHDDSDLFYRTKEELLSWKKNCPILNYENYLKKKRLISAETIREYRSIIAFEIKAAWENLKIAEVPKLTDFYE